MPDFLNPAQVRLQARAQSLAEQLATLADKHHSHPDKHHSDDAGLRAAAMAASVSAGIWELTQTPDTPALDLVIVRDALGHRNVGHLPGIFGPSPTLLADAPEPLRSCVLPKFLAGKLRSGFGFTEPPDAPRPTWARHDGDELVVNGQKSYVSGGSDADFINTLVEIEDSGPTMVLIETDRPGVQLTRRFGTLDGSHHAAFTFTDVRVPVGNVIGAPGAGMSRALSQINTVRMAIAAGCVGLCAYVMDQVEQHLRVKVAAPDTKMAVPDTKSGTSQTGTTRPTPIGNESTRPLGNESTRIRLGAIRVAAYAARSVVYRTARIVDTGENAVNEVMAAKVVATETVGALIDEGIQIVGGQALCDDHPFSSILRRVRALRLAEGPTDVLHGNIARGSLDLGLGRI